MARVHFDETDIYVNEKRQWLHVASNETLIYYECHGKRILEELTGITELQYDEILI